MKYLTPSYVRRLTSGVDVTDMTDDLLSMHILQAEGQVDSICRTEHQPRNWHQINQLPYQGQNIYSINSWPTPVTNVQNVTLQQATQAPTTGLLTTQLIPLNVMIQNDLGWFSVISFQALNGNLIPTGYYPGLNFPSPNLIFDYQTSWAFPVFGQTLTMLDDQVTFQSQQPFWLSSYSLSINVTPYVPMPVPPTVYVNGTATTTGFTINYAEGQIVFTASQAGNTVTADFAYSIPDGVREAARLLVFQSLSEQNPNLAGVAGFSSINLGNQISGMIRDPYKRTLDRVRVLLQPYTQVYRA